MGRTHDVGESIQPGNQPRHGNVEQILRLIKAVYYPKSACHHHGAILDNLHDAHPNSEHKINGSVIKNSHATPVTPTTTQ